MSKDVSQFGEFKFLKDYFSKNKPRYRYLVDVGAKGLTCSNSYNFIFDLDWSGILIEPEIKNYVNLKNLYTDKVNLLLYNVAVADFCGYCYLNIHKIEGHHSLIRQSNKQQICRAFTLNNLLHGAKTPLDFDLLSIDAEGMDYRILKKLFETSFYKPSVIIVEKNSFLGNEGLFEKNEYHLIFQTRGNYIYEKNK